MRLAAIISVLMCGLTVIATWTARSVYLNGWNDFLSFYAGGRLAFTADLYNPQAIADAQNQTAGTSGPALRFIRLPHYAVLLAPLALLPYYPAYLIWQSLNVAGVLGAVWLWPYSRRVFGFVVSLCFPMYWSLVNGQDLGLLLLAVVLAIRSMSSVSITACLAKFHFFWLAPIAIPRRLLVQVGMTTTALLLIPMLWVPEWPLAYYATVIDRRNVISNTPISLFRWLGIYGMLLAVAVGVWIARRTNREIAFSAAVAIAVVVSPHAYLQDYALLAPLVALVIERRFFRGSES